MTVRDTTSNVPITSREFIEGRRVIATIGIDHYRVWPSLDNAVNDAHGALAAFRRIGFEPLPPLLNEIATADAIRRLVTDDLATLRGNDSLVLFFAGHGHTQTRRLPTGPLQTGYIVPVDGDGPDGRTASWIRLDAWLSDVARIPARHVLVILDACHSGIALGSVIKWRSASSTRPGGSLDALRCRQSRRVITSALGDQRAMDGGPIAGHSLFTGCLIEGLTGGLAKDGRSEATGSEIGVYVQRHVTSYTGSRQTPDFGTLELDDRGELVVPILVDARPSRSEADCANPRQLPTSSMPGFGEREQAASSTVAAPTQPAHRIDLTPPLVAGWTVSNSTARARVDASSLSSKAHKLRKLVLLVAVLGVMLTVPAGITFKLRVAEPLGTEIATLPIDAGVGITALGDAPPDAYDPWQTVPAPDVSAHGAASHVPDYKVDDAPRSALAAPHTTANVAANSTAPTKVTQTRAVQEIPIPPVKELAFGSVSVDADVDNAEVYLDGGKHPDNTPTLITNVTEGMHVVEVRKPPGPPWKQTVEVDANQQANVRAVLASTVPNGALRILCDTEGARAFLDDTDMGLTPVDVKEVKAGNHVIQVGAPGFLPSERQVTVPAGSLQVANFKLSRVELGFLRVTSTVSEAMVFVDDREMGRAPQVVHLASGEHRLSVQSRNYKLFEQKVRVEANDTVHVHAKLKAVGRLRVLSTPSNADVTIHRNLRVGKTPLEIEVDAAYTSVLIEKPGYRKFHTMAGVQQGKIETVSADLVQEP